MHQRLYHKGVELVSVTSLQAIVAKPFLDKWRQGLCAENICGYTASKQIAEEAAGFSNVVHEEVAGWLTNSQLPECPSEWSARIVQKMIDGCVKKYLVEPEETLRCDKANLSGSPDMVCTGWGKTWIGDNKIKNSLDVATGAQLYGYRLLIRKVYGEDIKDGLVFFGNKKTGKLMLKWIDLDDWKKYFEALVIVWNIHHPARRIKLAELK